MLDLKEGVWLPYLCPHQEMIVLHAAVLDLASKHWWKTWLFECLAVSRYFDATLLVWASTRFCWSELLNTGWCITQWLFYKLSWKFARYFYPTNVFIHNINKLLSGWHNRDASAKFHSLRWYYHLWILYNQTRRQTCAIEKIEARKPAMLPTWVCLLLWSSSTIWSIRQASPVHATSSSSRKFRTMYTTRTYGNVTQMAWFSCTNLHAAALHLENLSEPIYLYEHAQRLTGTTPDASRQALPNGG